MKKFWQWLLAYFRLNDKAVCEMSKGRDDWNDYHDYHDCCGEPFHLELHHCRRCLKPFRI